MVAAAAIESWRRRIFPAVAMMFVLLLAACAPGNQISDGGTAPVIKGKTPPPVTVQELTGIPPDKAKELKEALALSAGQHDIGIIEGVVPAGTYSLTGKFRGEVQAGVTQIAYTWELRDDTGVLIDTIAGSETVGPAAADPWASVTAAVLQQIAEATSRGIAAKLAQMGYATRAGSLVMPPAHTFMAAGPGAQNDIDLETLNGPSAFAPMGETVAAVAEPEVPPEPEPGTEKSGKVEIRVVAVVPVEGSPGQGNAELTEAMRRALKTAGWPVVDRHRADALVVRGSVDLSKPEGAKQKVALRWAVETPQGKSLGDVKQANSVPAGSLDQGWGGAEQAVADAAASGIFDIIKRYR